MTFKEFWNKVKDKIWMVLVAIAGVVLTILGIRKGKANKQSEKDKELADDIAKEKTDVKEEIKKIDETVSEAKKVVEEAEQKKEESQTVVEKIDEQVKKNESILEKYK